MRDAAERDVRPSCAPLNAVGTAPLTSEENGALYQPARQNATGQAGLGTGTAMYVQPNPTPPRSPNHRQPSAEPSDSSVSPRSRLWSHSGRDLIGGPPVLDTPEEVLRVNSRREVENPLAAHFAAAAQMGSDESPSGHARGHGAPNGLRTAPTAPRGWTHGQITVFSVAHCSGCRKVKALLTAKKWPFVDISLTEYPLAYELLVELSNRHAVPQVWFNEELIGGVAECEAMDATGRLEAKYAAMAGTVAPRNSLFHAPQLNAAGVAGNPSGTGAADASRGAFDTPICFAGECASYSEVMTRLVEGPGVGCGLKLKIVDKPASLRMRRVRRCFTGKALVDVLLARWPSLGGRVEAAEVGALLLKSRMFTHLKRTERRVAKTQKKLREQGGAVALPVDFEFADTDSVHYRLQADAVPLVLNSWRVYEVPPFDSFERVDAEETCAFAIVERCRVQLYSIIETHVIDGEQGRVAYDAVSRDARFRDFEEATCALQAVDIAAMCNNERIAFVLNVYNVCILHAFAKFGRPESGLARAAFFNCVSCNVGGHIFSLSELESGILRGNRPPPYTLAGAPFKRGDPRAAIALPTCDERIHFALNCGALSCPAISSFTPNAVDRELRIAALAFCEDEDNVRVDVARRTVMLSQIFHWCVSAHSQLPALECCAVQLCLICARACPAFAVRSRFALTFIASRRAAIYPSEGMPSISAIRPARSCGGLRIGCAASARRSCAACWAMGAGSASGMLRMIGLRTP